MKLLGKVRTKNFFLLYLITSFLFLIVASNVYIGAVHVTSASTSTPSPTSSPESWVNITITPMPVSRNRTGETFTIDVNIVNVTNLRSWDITLKWKLGRLDCTDVQEGPFLKPGGFTFFTSSIFNNDGKLVAGNTLLSPYIPQSGDGILASATFEVIETGGFPLELDETALVNSSLLEIDHTAIDGYFYTTSPAVEPIFDPPYSGSFFTPLPILGHPIVGETLTFNGSGCYDPDQSFKGQTGTGIVSYKWDFGDGNVTDPVPDPVITHVYRYNGTMTLNLTVTDDEGETDWETVVFPIKLHDIAIINVTVSSTEVLTGDSVYVNVTVLNEGSGGDSFNVTAYYIGIDVGMNTTYKRSLLSGHNTTVTFQWNTTGFALGTYALFANAHLIDTTYINISLADLEEDKADNAMYGDEITITGTPVHDIAVTKVTVEPTQLEIDDTSEIKVTVKNEGNTAETDVKVNATARNTSGIVFQAQQQLDLTAGSSQTLSFTWFTGNETAQEGSYNITVVALQVSGETETSDNTYPVVTVTMQMLPVANFTYSPSEPFVGGILTFNASSSYAPGTPAPGEPTGTIAEYIWNFGDGNITTVSSPVTTHTYHAKGDYSVTVTVKDNDDLSNSHGKGFTVLLHDIVVTDVTFSPNSVIAGELVFINATVENIGDYNETFISIVAYFSTTTIGKKVISVFEPGAETTVQLSWNTTGVADGTYNLMASASIVQGEANTENNRRIGGTITIEKVTLKMSAHPTTITIDAAVMINGTVETAQGTVAGADVTIWYMPSEGDWSVLATVTTDVNGYYSREWTPAEPGSYAVKATWPGETALVESDVYAIMVQEAPKLNIFLYTTAGLGVATILLAALMVYFLRVKKPT